MMKWPMTILALLALASCQHREEALDPTLENFFASDEAGGAQKPTQFVDAMAAAGSRADATLFAHHFDGRRLNSLGEAKLARMAAGDRAAEPMRVYLNLDERDSASKDRRAAAAAFLKDAGLADSQIEIGFGQNPDNWSPASKHLENLPKTDTGAADGKTPEASAGAADKATGTSAAGGGAGATGGDVNLFK